MTEKKSFLAYLFGGKKSESCCNIKITEEKEACCSKPASKKGGCCNKQLDQRKRTSNLGR